MRLDPPDWVEGLRGTVQATHLLQRQAIEKTPLSKVTLAARQSSGLPDVK